VSAPLDTTTPPGHLHVLGTPLVVTTYADWIAYLQRRVREPGVLSVDFSNTQIVTMRRGEPWFRGDTSRVDYFLPDGMPLVWCLNAQGAGLPDRVYGPAFMRQCVIASPAPFTHYFLGASEACLTALTAVFQREQPHLLLLGSHHGYFSPAEDADIVAEINRLSPDFIWVGLGTPKQQTWIHCHKHEFHRGAILAVGQAFDVNAGMKPDAPAWMQRLGLAWAFRMALEPTRLVRRYGRYNSLFLFYLLWDGLRGRAFSAAD
jgi:N-acetylglucosaminyldiphosphoundecaprenol N-acetyl-beta-D-mannosaminyltransferase